MTTTTYRKIERWAATAMKAAGSAAVALGLLTWLIPQLGMQLWLFIFCAVTGVFSVLAWAAADLAAADADDRAAAQVGEVTIHVHRPGQPTQPLRRAHAGL